MDEADEMRELREEGGERAVQKELINKIARGYRAVDTAKRMEGGDKNE